MGLTPAFGASKHELKARRFPSKAGDFFLRESLGPKVCADHGVLLYRVPFPEGITRFDNMTMHGDHLFLVDPFDQACVYEYTIVDEPAKNR